VTQDTSSSAAPNVPPARKARDAYDAIVVGSGMSGGWAAKELCERGLKVLLVERGRAVVHGQYPTEWMQPWQFELRGRNPRPEYDRDYPIQSKNYAFGEATKHFYVKDTEHPYLTPEDKPFRWIRGYHLGGRSLLWARWVWRWSDLDFEANARDGHGVDWPIRYRDLAPWYDHVERFIGVSANRDGIPVVPDGEFLPAWEMNCAERQVRDGIARHYRDRRLIIGRSANITRPHGGRTPCQARNQCARGCSFGAYFSSLSATLPAAEKTGNLTVVTDAIAERVLYDEKRGRASGVRVVDRVTKEDREYVARIVFVCASTLGTAQLLLNSRSARFPQGIANGSGALGRHLMDHPFQTGARANVPGLEEEYYSGRRPVGVYVPRFRNVRAPDADRLGFLRGYGLQGGATRPGWGRGSGQPGFGAELKQALREPGPWQISLTVNGEMLPRAENYVELDPDQKDQWGIPLLRVHCAFSDNERALLRDGMTQAAEVLEAAGCRDVRTFDNNAPPGFNIHEMGTARMGRDPKTSVLNGHNQAHEVPNLFVTDGACMASTSCVNPSLTYMAITARAANFAADEMQRGTL